MDSRERERERKREREITRDNGRYYGQGGKKERSTKERGIEAEIRRWHKSGYRPAIEPMISIVPRMEDSAFLAVACQPLRPEAGIS